MSLGEANIQLMESKFKGKGATKKALAQVNYEKAKLIRDKRQVDTPNYIEGVVLPPHISTDYNSIKDYGKVVAPLANQFANSSGMEVDDLEQEGMIAYMQCLEKFPERDNKAITLTTYAWLFVKNAMIDYSRKQERWDKMEYRDDIDTTVIEDTTNPEDEFLHKEQVEYAREKVAKLQKDMNERERYVLWHTILTDDPMTYRDIAEQFHCSKDAIFRDMNRIKKLLAEESD